MKNQYWLIGIIVLVISCLVFFRNYSQPHQLFWDENYHIASAYKYLGGKFFMSDHPPLGIMFIALGEALFHPNRQLDTSAFVTTDYIKTIPSGFSFVGVRFFPVVFATLSAVVFYLILCLFLKNPIFAGLFSSLYLFDNALIVHSRGAMLDSIQIFFVLCSLCWFFWMIEKKHFFIWKYAVLGLLTGLALAVKLNSWIILLLIPIGLLFMPRQKKDRWLIFISQAIDRLVAASLATTLVFFGTYLLHVQMARQVIDDRYYNASVAYRTIIDHHATGSVVNIPLMIVEQLFYIPNYEKGVPIYDVCKPNENGSQPWTWPFGNKTINYRWETANGKTRYLYLVGNPVIWLIGLVGLILSLVLIISRFIFGLRIKNVQSFNRLAILVLLYSIYIVSIATLPRVMYLYHYFIPLLLSLLTVPLIFDYLFSQGFKKQPTIIYGLLIVVVGVVILIFLFFAPLTYYQPLTTAQFNLRNWFVWWHLKPI